MSQTLNSSPRALREAFYALSAAQEIPDARLLDDLVRQHPQYGAELTEFAIALAVDALRGDRAIEAAEAAIDPAWSGVWGRDKECSGPPHAAT